MATKNTQKIGWIGMGRMGFPMAERLLKAGHDVSIWNRTRAKAEPLAKIGGKVVDHLSELKDVDVLFSIVATGKDVQEVCTARTACAARAARCRRSWSIARPSRSRNPPRSATSSNSSAPISSPRR